MNRKCLVCNAEGPESGVWFHHCQKNQMEELYQRIEKLEATVKGLCAVEEMRWRNGRESILRAGKEKKDD